MRFLTGSRVSLGVGLEGEETEADEQPGSLKLRCQVFCWRGGSCKLLGDGLGEAKTVWMSGSCFGAP